MSREKEKLKLIEELKETKNEKSSLLYDIYGDHDEIEEPDENRDPMVRVDQLQRKEDKLNKEIRKIDFEEENDLKIANFNFDRRNEVAVIDKESEVDLLEREPQAKATARLIANKQTIAPLAIGIYGKWGLGKSTFLHLVQKNLNEINKKIASKDSIENKDYAKSYIVKFNPTEYDDNNMIWYAILKELYIKYDAETGFKGRIKFAFRNLIPFGGSKKMPYLLSALLILLNVVAFFIFFADYNSILDVIKKSRLFINILSAGLIFITAVHVVIPFVKKFLFIIKPLSSKMLQHMLIPDYKTKLGTREEVKQSLDDLLRIWLKKNEKIVLIVDELDRCSEKTIVSFFSALQLFLSSNSIIKVISMNEELVALALADNNKYLLKDNVTREDKLIFGHEYLQKYISIPINLNINLNYENYVSTLLSEEITFFDVEERKVIATLISEIAKVKEVTPREIKRIINLLILSKENVNAQFESLKYKITFSEYITWFFVNYFNPVAADFFVKQIKYRIHYEEYKYMSFKKMYNLFLRESKAEGDQIIKYLRKQIDLKIEVIITADYLIKSSLIR